MIEKRLIAKAKAGDQIAFEQLVALHATQVYGVAIRALGHRQEAEDVAQETFIRAWKALPKFRGEANFSTWLYRIATNLCYNQLPRLKREMQSIELLDEFDLPAATDSLEKKLLSADIKKELQQALDLLPESYRLLITLRHMQELSYEEIAQVVDMPLGTVKAGLYRARRQLRTALKDLYERT